MKNIAKLKADKVENLIVCRAEQKPTEFGPDYVDVPQDVGIGWIQHPDGAFIEPQTIAPPILDINQVRTDALVQVDALFLQTVEALLAEPVETRQEAFALACKYILAILESKAKTTELFNNEGTVLGIPGSVNLANALAHGSVLFNKLGTALGHYTKRKAEIRAAATVLDIQTAATGAENDFKSLQISLQALGSPIELRRAAGLILVRQTFKRFILDVTQTKTEDELFVGIIAETTKASKSAIQNLNTEYRKAVTAIEASTTPAQIDAAVTAFHDYVGISPAPAPLPPLDIM